MDIELVFCGDTMLAPERLGADPFVKVRPMLQGADLAFCNLETSLASDAVRPLKRHVLMADAENLDFLAGSGFAIVNLANNHILDNGLSAARRMIELVEAKGMKTVGLRENGKAKQVIVERQGKKLGFLGYADYGFPDTFMPLRERMALKEVSTLRAVVDCVVVSLHWGYEYVDFPHPNQQRFARRLIDCGAQLVIGHHPHVVQGIEEYQGGLIAYSLGNFQFQIDLNDAYLNSGSGMILRVWRSGTGGLRYQTVPIETTASGCVEARAGEAARRSQQRILELSWAVNGADVGAPFWFREAAKIYFPQQLESWRYRIAKYGSEQKLRMLLWLLKPFNFLLLLSHLACSSRAVRFKPAARPKLSR